MAAARARSPSYMNERDFPHVVELPPSGFRDQNFDSNAFHHEGSVHVIDIPNVRAKHSFRAGTGCECN